MSEKKKKQDSRSEEKRQAKYGTWTCVKWLFTRMWSWDKSMVICSVAVIPLVVILYAFGLYTPSLILESLETASGFETVALTVAVLFLAQLLFRLIKIVIDALRNMAFHRHSMRFYYELVKKRAENDYYLYFDTEYLKNHERAWAVLGNNVAGGPGHFLLNGANTVANVLCFVMFGSIISLLHPAIFLLLVGLSVVNLLLGKWRQKRDHVQRDERIANGRKLNYLTWHLSANTQIGKDVRAYNMAPFLDAKGKTLIDENIRLNRYRQNINSVTVIAGHLLSALRDGAAYAVLIAGAVNGRISSSEFVLYFSAISQMSGFIGGILGYLGSLHEMKLQTSDCIEHLDSNYNRMNHGKGIEKPTGRPLSVEFRNVTYKYPQGEKNVLEHVSFRIEPGEKISLVGLNGAGKTTLTLLMCGLLLPDEGEVLIDGHTVFAYNCDDLYSLFSLLPQNSTLIPTSIAENVALCDRAEIDEGKLWQALELAGIAEKIRSLKNGIETGMDKQYDPDAVNFSGGEMQKLLLARVLYHNAPIMILDEPTAALDPIAEHNMYCKYNELVSGATSVFISHRLASARFCDRIYLLDGARFAECGTHEELMAKGGKYKELFDIQSKYYKEGDGEA